MSIQEALEGPASEARPIESSPPYTSFARKLAGYYIAERGFRPDFPPEAAPLAAAADIVLSFFDGAIFELVGIVDGERYPGKVMALTVEQLREIAAANFKYAPSASIFRAHNAVRITIIEVTQDIHSDARYGSLAKLARNGLIEKRRIEICVADPALDNCYATRKATLRFVRSVLTRPPLSDERIQSALTVRPMPVGRPYATYGLLGLLALCFLCEYWFNIGPLGPMAAPSVATLISLGGVKQPLILDGHEWFRLWTAVLLHINAEHILWNGLALYLAGRLLEPMVGRAHFLALFVIGGLCGALASTFWNAPILVSVGASGAITGCFAAVTLFAFKFPPGAVRTSIWRSSIYILLPAVLPFLNFRQGLNIDYADHVGGIIGGLVYGGVLYAIWPRDQLQPGGRWMSMLMIAIGVAGSAFGAIAVSRSYPENVQLVALASEIAKDFEVERLWTASIKGADEFTFAYPKDPRGHVGRAIYYLDTRQTAAAETEAKLALDQTIILDKLLPPIVRQQAIAVLALAEGRQGRTDEAKETARPVCTTTFSFQRFLVQEGLCAATAPK